MLDPLSPYAYSKMAFELALKDKCMAGGLNAVVLRYFNPIGADPYMRTGPYKAAPTHLLGVLTKAAAEGWPFTIYGDDYPTRDGTALRDYVHVWDLACAHLSSLAYLRGRHTPFEAINVGAGQGVTVGEFARTFLEVSGAAIPVHTGPRRAGDAAGAYADISKARRLLKWQPKRSLRQGISDALVWERHFRAGGLDKLSQKPPNFH